MGTHLALSKRAAVVLLLGSVSVNGFFFNFFGSQSAHVDSSPCGKEPSSWPCESSDPTRPAPRLMHLPDSEGPILVIADVHGHPTLVKHAILHGIKLAGRKDITVVFLGDYLDNGPRVPETLDLLIKLRKNNSEKQADLPEYAQNLKYKMILGNHDIAGLNAYDSSIFHVGGDEGIPGRPGKYSKDWFDKWTRNYQSGIPCNTPCQYNGGAGKGSQQQFFENFPDEHRDFLKDTPWYEEEDNYTFVHAGLDEKMSIAEQLEPLGDLESITYPNPDVNGKWGFLPDPIREKKLAEHDSTKWERIVVSGHNKFDHEYLRRLPGRYKQDFLGKKRINLHSGSDRGHGLNAILLPRGMTTVDKDKIVQFTINADREPEKS